MEINSGFTAQVDTANTRLKLDLNRSFDQPVPADALGEVKIILHRLETLTKKLKNPNTTDFKYVGEVYSGL